MRRLFAFACLAWAVVLAADGAGQAADLQPAVDRLYPADRLDLATAAERPSCYEVLETGPANGARVLLAGYVDRSNGVVRLLRRDEAGSLQVVFDSPPTWRLPGTRTGCVIRLQDVDFDGRPEAFVYFEGVRASVGWIFKWDGVGLSNLTPTRPDGDRESSVLLDPAVYDLEHSGPLRVIAMRDIAVPPPGVPAPSPAFVYRLGPSGYEVETSVLAVMGFRADVDPRSNLRTFRLVTDSSPPYTLRIVNGDRDGRHRVTGATIGLNNTDVVGPSQVHEGMQFATVGLAPLLIQNHVTAALTGPPDAYIVVLVQDSTRRVR
ncbi:MAG: hypothetical protein HY657_19770 [Acidobacteria bacterium]|nr:hypothetical protein [Acidobacteriota bacterium]